MFDEPPREIPRCAAPGVVHESPKTTQSLLRKDTWVQGCTWRLMFSVLFAWQVALRTKSRHLWEESLTARPV